MNEDQKENKARTVLKAIGSVLIAVIASSHHWVHTLLIALGLTSLGAGLLSMSPSVKSVFLFISFIVSLWFLRITRKKWKHDRASAWVYLISSIVSIVLVVTAVPQTIASFNLPAQQEQQNQLNHSHSH